MKRLLIANRGEIACRIMRSARELGIHTIAVFSEADRNARHVSEADEAHCIGPAPAAKSYLVKEHLLEAARVSRADAIHPGYGFLSENADFAQNVLDAGLIWVGPSPDLIRMMGDKQNARVTAKQAGVPIVPGSTCFAVDQIEGVAEAADTVGFPLLVKATAGGGGIGMREVDRPEKLEEAVRGVQRAALSAFGEGAIYLERFIPRARHVEIQVFGFGDDNPLHFFERDCSLQRRFQKVLEESPSPRLPDSVRNHMCEAALTLCRQTRYSGAGTVEFIVDADTFEFFFLEMNTRIQVEHPVTEMLTGVDLVRLQLLLSSEKLTDQDRVAPSRKGAAIEARLYAENPNKSFFPSPGTLQRFVLPAASQTVRIDSGYREKDAITPFYDPMVAKIIVWGETREQAIETAQSALAQTHVEGLMTNRDFLIACLDHPAFRAGDVHTGFIQEHRDVLIPQTPRTPR